MKYYLFIFPLFYWSVTVPAQNKFKFGDCPLSLLETTVYENDTTASAFVVYEDCDVRYDISSQTSDFEILSDYVVRIKILTQDGVDFANATIPFQEGSSSTRSEKVRGLTGWTYNLENGKIVKQKLSKDYVFTEDVTKNFKRMKFALPAVKVGSVIEYKYTIASPFYTRSKDYKFQRSIPVQYSRFCIRIPEYFKFHREVKGYHFPTVNITPINQTFIVKGRFYNCTSEEVTAVASDVPAMKDEAYVWNYHDFLSGIGFELRSINFPGSYYKEFSHTWDKVVEQLNNYGDFGKSFNEKNILKKELPAALVDKTTAADSMMAVLDLVRSKVKWNERSLLWVNDQQQALKEGSGTSAAINAILLNALKNAGFEAYPVAMSLRSRGRISMTHPSIDDLNYFIVCVLTGNSACYLDATREFTGLNVIPIDCMVEKALIIYPKYFDWVDLTKITNNVNRIGIVLNFNEEGFLSGQKSETYTGETAYLFKQDYEKAGSKENYIASQESKNDISISEYTMEAKGQPDFGFIESYRFTQKNIHAGDDVLTFNPLLFFAMKNNAFKSETRELPVEFPFPHEQRIYVSCHLPEGYAVEELPPSERFVYEDGLMEFAYMIQADERIIQLSYRVKLNTCIVPAMNYETLRDFWAKMYNKENELITIKKINL